MSDTPLTCLSAKLQELTGSKPPSYRQLYAAALSAVFPTERRNSRLYVLDHDLPKVAEAFGLTIAIDEAP